MHTSLSPNVRLEQAVVVPRCDRWRICYRLQELTISCSCPSDGSLRVEIHHGNELILIRSVIQQFSAPRQELVNWLERCWLTTVTCKENH